MNTFLEAELVLFTAQVGHTDLTVWQPALFLETVNKAVLFEEPSRFLFEHFVNAGATPSKHTWARAAYCLKSWFQYCQAIKLDWKDANAQDRRDFRDAYLNAVSPRTGESYGAKGIADAMSVVRTFYVFARGKGWYAGDIGQNMDLLAAAAQTPIDLDALAHIRGVARKSRDRDLPKARPSQAIYPLLVRDLKCLLNHVGPPAAARQGDQRPARDRLICDLGWAVGLRVAEIVSLTTLQFLNLNPDPATPNVNLSLTIVGKGRKMRQVAIPTWLVLDALEYIDGERNDSLRANKDRPRHPPVQMLLAHQNSSNRRGKPITVDAIQKMIREACISLGLVEAIEKTDPETSEVFTVKVPKHSIHDLRHTYAVLTFHAERAMGNAEPWKKIQAQLGHKHLQTTIDTYLAHVEIFTDQPGLLDVRKMLGL